jgi:hypothetical protein
VLPVRSWRVHYADGSTFSSADGTWAEVPPFGVQCVVYYHVPPYVTLQVEDGDPSVYRYEGPEGYEGPKMGLWMDTEGHYRIVDAAGRSEPP